MRPVQAVGRTGSVSDLVLTKYSFDPRSTFSAKSITARTLATRRRSGCVSSQISRAGCGFCLVADVRSGCSQLTKHGRSARPSPAFAAAICNDMLA